MSVSARACLTDVRGQPLRPETDSCASSRMAPARTLVALLASLMPSIARTTSFQLVVWISSSGMLSKKAKNRWRAKRRGIERAKDASW